MQSAVQTILKKPRVKGLLHVTYLQEMERRHRRKYGDHPVRTEKWVGYVVQVQRSQGAISAAQRLLGWRLYPVNAPPEEFSLAEAV